MKSTRSLGLKLLAIWLILAGLVPLIGLHFAGLPQILGALAIVAGVLLLLDR